MPLIYKIIKIMYPQNSKNPREKNLLTKTSRNKKMILHYISPSPWELKKLDNYKERGRLLFLESFIQKLLNSPKENIEFGSQGHWPTFLVRKSLLLLFKRTYLAKEPTYLINNALAFLEDWQGINSICLKTRSFVLKEFLNSKKKNLHKMKNIVHVLPFCFIFIKRAYTYCNIVCNSNISIV